MEDDGERKGKGEALHLPTVFKFPCKMDQYVVVCYGSKGGWRISAFCQWDRVLKGKIQIWMPDKFKRRWLETKVRL